MVAVKQASGTYEAFQQLDGHHPLQDVVPDSCVMYQVRELGQGRVTYFNYDLAKEMGLITTDHPQVMTKDLHDMLIKTFSLRIVNEYDELAKRRFSEIKPRKYMATRYLQLQHQSRTGKTSGDGRGIWNGVVKHKGKIWDVSSRGTGVTRLSPGAVEAQKPLKTGNTQFGYGCGLADIDELMASAIQSEIFHRQGINTERTLCIIDLGNNVGIGVRAGLNLLRPAHMFIYLKQNRRAELQKIYKYFVDREKTNGAGQVNTTSIISTFARFAARLEREYIFTWVAWDGDNLLANAGIIDYGSIRQFGAFHHHYRYDDVDRYSTRLIEQKEETRNLMLTIAQLISYVETGTKKKATEFRRHSAIKKFNKIYAQEVEAGMIRDLGFKERDAQLLQGRYRTDWKQLKHAFKTMERWYDPRERKLADGVNKPALISMRIFLKTLSHWLTFNPTITDKDIKEILKASCTQRSYMALTSAPEKINMTRNFIQTYQRLLKNFGRSSDAVLKRMYDENAKMRITGNALINIVDMFMTQNKRKSDTLIQKLIDNAIDLGSARPSRRAPRELQTKIVNLTEEHAKEI